MIDFNSFGTVQGLVSFINSSDDKEMIAAQYAADAQKEAGFPLCEASATCHLEVIKGFGADFCVEKACDLALAIVL